MASGGGRSGAEALTHFAQRGERESLASVGRQSEYDRPKSAFVLGLHSAFELYEFGRPLGLFPVGLPLDFGG